MGAFSGERVLHFGCCPILTGNNNNHWHPSPSAAASCRLQRAFLKYQLSSAHDKIKHFLFRKKNQVCISFIQRGAETVVTGLGSCTLVHLPAGRSAGGKTTQRNNDRPLPSNGHGLSPIHTFFRVVLVCLPPVRLPPIHCLS